MTSVTEDTQSETIDENTGQQRFAHYANSVSVTEGYITGKSVVAICGKVFVPTRDPNKFPVCPICKELAEALMLGTE
tara:strand:+ start:1290 stop:1520 length:231 start_codon:yes stop_codon:yes gene_type:complete